MNDGKFHTRSLPCELTEQEYKDRARELTDTMHDRDKIELERTEHAKTLKWKMDRKTTEIQILARTVRTKEEDRQVQCEHQTDYEDAVVNVVRLDTGEIVGSRPMTHEERQQQLRLNTPTSQRKSALSADPLKGVAGLSVVPEVASETDDY